MHSLRSIKAFTGAILVHCTLADAVSNDASATPTKPAKNWMQKDARLGPCINMANFLEPPNEGDWGRPFTDTDFADVAAKGFETVRLPVRFAGHALTIAPYTIDKAFMERAAYAVKLARAAKLRVIIDMHNYDELMADPASQKARFTGLWKQVAARFKREDGNVWFELMNEPNDRLDNTNLLSVYEPAMAEIRATNPIRKVVIGGGSWSGLESLATLPMPKDRNVIATFHYYDPFNFTHQGASWAEPAQPLGTQFGGKADLDQLAKDVAKAKAYMTRSGRPLFMGETGAFEAVPLAQRALYYKSVHDAFGAAGIDQCVWGYTNTFPFRDAKTGEWYTPLLRAIGL